MNLVFFLFFPLTLFFIGFAGLALNRKNLLTIIMSIELILLSINFNFLIFSAFLDDRLGQIITLLVLTIAAAETSIGLAILIVYYRVRGGIALDTVQTLRS